MASVATRRAPSASEQLQARMASLAKEKSTSPTLSSMKPITLEQMYGHRRPNIVGSIAKGEARTARTSLVSGSQSQSIPKLRDPTNSKIPFSLRVNFLNKIFSQYLEVCPEVEAVRNSEIEEKAILDKVRHAQGYKVAAINLIGRIRNAKSTGLSKPRAALSHDAVLAGRHVNDISIRVRKTEKHGVSTLTEKEYPRAVAGDDQLVTIAPSHFEKSKSQKSWAEKDDLERLCSRCHKEFRLDPKGNVVTAECIYHFKGLQRRGGMRGESYFSCCGADRNTPGCCVAEAHVSDTLNAEALREFTPTPPSRGEDDPRNEKVYAMDCEMVYGVWGPELARVSVVDMDNKLVLDLIVKPHNRVIDYNTRFSGLTANQVEASTIDLFEAQNRLFELVNEQSILIGHSLESDLKAMRLRHEKVVDTAVVYEHRQGFPFKRALRNLASEYLQKIIQEDDSGHDSQEDAATCMSLMLLKAKDEVIDMASAVGKVQKLGKTLWEHKKKTITAGILVCVAGNYAATWHMNSKIRTAYALQAKKYGDAPVSAEERPRRVLVVWLRYLLSNENGHVTLTMRVQLEALAAAVDTQEADAIYIVGGDGTLGRVVTGILRNRLNSLLPIGVFPGGYDNLSLKRLAPHVFESSKDVRRMCESAMALIEEQSRKVQAFEFTLEGDESALPIYGVGDVGAGWFRHIEERRRKLWYFGRLKRRWAYLWEMLKRSPTDMEAKMLYEEACTGCRRCRPPVVFEPPAWRWWHILTGPPRLQEPEVKQDYSNVENENCGRIREVDLKGTDLIIENNQQEVRMGGEEAGRKGVVAEGWRRCSNNRVGTSDNDDFYTTDLLAKAISLTFVKLPEFIHRLYVSSDHVSEPPLEGKKINVKSTDRYVEITQKTIITSFVASQKESNSATKLVIGLDIIKG
ncbi:diacylglycerol kinase catalytic domain protein, partial [Ostertagia ostertagi]